MGESQVEGGSRRQWEKKRWFWNLKRETAEQATDGHKGSNGGQSSPPTNLSVLPPPVGRIDGAKFWSTLQGIMTQQQFQRRQQWLIENRIISWSKSCWTAWIPVFQSTIWPQRTPTCWTLCTKPSSDYQGCTYSEFSKNFVICLNCASLLILPPLFPVSAGSHNLVLILFSCCLGFRQLFPTYLQTHRLSHKD